MIKTHSDLDDTTPLESATAVLLRPAIARFEVLMLKKNSSINYGGSWVFPGGVVEACDQLKTNDEDDTRIATARRTAIRETAEETGLSLEPRQLLAFSNWLTPKLKIKRYNTLFFVAVLNDQQSNQAIKIDREEIVDFQWASPKTLLDAQNNGEILLNGPSFVTLSMLNKAQTANNAGDLLVEDTITYYHPRGLKTTDGLATLYEGDSAYETQKLDAETVVSHQHPQHRLYMRNSGPWEFIDTRDH